MGRILLQIVLNGLGVWIASKLPIGVHFSGGLLALLLVGLVMGLINLFVRPIVTFFSFPLIVLSLGLFFLVINGLMLWFAAKFVPHYLQLEGCGAAIWGGLVIAACNWLAHVFTAGK